MTKLPLLSSIEQQTANTNTLLSSGTLSFNVNNFIDLVDGNDPNEEAGYLFCKKSNIIGDTIINNAITNNYNIDIRISNCFFNSRNTNTF